MSRHVLPGYRYNTQGEQIQGQYHDIKFCGERIVIIYGAKTEREDKEEMGGVFPSILETRVCEYYNKKNHLLETMNKIIIGS